MDLKSGDRVEVKSMFGPGVWLGTVVRLVDAEHVVILPDGNEMMRKPPPGLYDVKDCRRVTGCAATEL